MSIWLIILAIILTFVIFGIIRSILGLDGLLGWILSILSLKIFDDYFDGIGRKINLTIGFISFILSVIIVFLGLKFFVFCNNAIDYAVNKSKTSIAIKTKINNNVAMKKANTNSHIYIQKIKNRKNSTIQDIKNKINNFNKD